MAKRTTQARPKTAGDVNADRDVIFGDQYNVDLGSLASRLDEIIALLKQQAAVRVEVSGRDNIVVVGEGNDVRVAAADLARFAALQRDASPQRREEIYLAQFILEGTYARWERDYVPLAGHLLEAPLRLNDRDDQAISGAGLPLKNLLDALTQYHKTRLVILGEPGAGKTTTLHRLALELARARLRDPLQGMLPVRADLFKFTDDVQPDDFLQRLWERCDLGRSYATALAEGQVCFLLDGLNQMPQADRAKRIERWRLWATQDLRANNWAVFTCRTADYVTKLRLPEVHVQALDEGRMRAFFERRFGPERAAGLWADFEKRLRSGDDRFDKLARNPFMLAQLADRCDEGKPLTDNRSTLMDDLAARLLTRELSDFRQPEAYKADERGTFNAMLEALSRLAFDMQARGEGTGLPRTLAEQVTLGQAGQMQLSLDEVLQLASDATLLDITEKDEHGTAQAFAFYHHLLQEYFAARELLRRFRAGQNVSKRWRTSWRWWQFMPRRLAAGERLEPPPVSDWDETVIMAAGLAGKDAARFITEVKRGNLPLAGRCLAEAGPERDDLKALAAETRTELLNRQRSGRGLGRAHLRARIGAGLALGELGHPELTPQKFEFEGGAVWAILPPMETVAAGEFIRGSDAKDRRAYADEHTTERRITLPAFAIGRYPVTNAEFKWFVEAGGYKDERRWSDAGRVWKQGGPEAHATAIEDWFGTRAIIKKEGVELLKQAGWRPQSIRYWKEVADLSDDEARERARQAFDRPFDRPGFWDDNTLNSPARPVVGVNWYEAEAYCAWLSAITGMVYRLPGEMEWEKAARGVDGREYPWGERFDSTRCNTVESHIYTTTPVGLYPDGVSPFGLFDASGNVREWTADWFQAYPGGEADASKDFGEKYRVVRGGSWVNDHRYARCAYRNRLVPDDFTYGIGFRVFSPVLS